MMIRWWEHSQKGVTDRQTDRQTDRRTDGRTENAVHRAAWSQLKSWNALEIVCHVTDKHISPPHYLFISSQHDDVIKWKPFLRNWPFVWGIHRSPVSSAHKGQWCGALMFSLSCASTNVWVNNSDSGDLRRHHAHYDVTVMKWIVTVSVDPSSAVPCYTWLTWSFLQIRQLY